MNKQFILCTHYQNHCILRATKLSFQTVTQTNLITRQIYSPHQEQHTHKCISCRVPYVAKMSLLMVKQMNHIKTSCKLYINHQHPTHQCDRGQEGCFGEKGNPPYIIHPTWRYYVQIKDTIIFTHVTKTNLTKLQEMQK